MLGGGGFIFQLRWGRVSFNLNLSKALIWNSYTLLQWSSSFAAFKNTKAVVSNPGIQTVFKNLPGDYAEQLLLRTRGLASALSCCLLSLKPWLTSKEWWVSDSVVFQNVHFQMAGKKLQLEVEVCFSLWFTGKTSSTPGRSNLTCWRDLLLFDPWSIFTWGFWQLK